MTATKKRRVHVDFETRSTVNLKKTGVTPYAKHKTTDAWCMAYAIDDGPVKLWKMGDPFPADLPVPSGGTDPDEDDFVYVAHNAPFEIAIWRHVMHARHGWPLIPLKYWRCTMAMAYTMALPGSLDGAAKAVGLPHEKDMAGNRLMLQMAKPRKIEEDGEIIWWDVPEKLEKLYSYCKQDIVVERALDDRILDLPPADLEVWRADQIENETGVPIDIKEAKRALEVIDDAAKLLDREMREVTDRAVGGCTKVKDLIAWLQTQGVETDTVAKADVVTLLELPDLPQKARRALELRQLGSKSSTAKIKAMIEAACPDGRVRGAHQYHGATTGRWAGRVHPSSNTRSTKSWDCCGRI